MSDQKDYDLSNPINKLMDMTKEKRVKWESTNSEKKVKYFDLLVNNLYKNYDIKNFRYYEAFELISEKVDLYVAKIYIPNVTYTHLSICEKNMKGLLIDHNDSFNGAVTHLFNLVKIAVTEQTIDSI